MIFETRIRKCPLRQRFSLPWVYDRRNSATNLQENKVTVLVLGSNQVGKSTMIDFFTKNKLVIQDEPGVNSGDGPVEIIVELMRFDASTGAAMRKFVIQTAHAFVLMYSLDNTESVRNIKMFKEEIESLKGKGMPMVVVGNKVDKSKPKIYAALKKKDELKIDGIPHIKVSFAHRINTKDVYKTLFQHETLKKLTNAVFKINEHKMFSDLRRLSWRADALEETVAKCFGPHGNVSKFNTKENIKSPGIFKKLGNLLKKQEC